MSTTTFGLSYLNEQQRFTRTPGPVRVTTRLVTMDFKQTIDAPLATHQQTHNAVRQYAPLAAHTQTVAPIAVCERSEVEQTVISEQFEEPDLVKRHRLKKFLPVAVAAVAFLSGLTVLGLSLHQNHKAAAQVAAITQRANTSADGTATKETPPSEEPVTAAARAQYVVAPDMPRYLTIKKINVYARVLSMGILSSGALATPRNTNDTGWYNGSNKPGDGGTALVVGHVLGGTKTGIFYNLKKLSEGDVITIERGDGTKIDYRVVATEQIAADKVDTNKLLLPVTAGKAGLNLMTCGGQFQSETESFSDRFIVYTERV